MRLDVVALASDLKPGQLRGRVVVVLDVLRATTTMIAALAAGVAEIRVFPDTASVRAAEGGPDVLRCGEEKCLKPAGFDLGNSPGAFSSIHKGKTLLMSTTNGTRAILAAREADRILVGGLVNASAVARALRQLEQDAILLCAGTNGEVAEEDMLGAGAIIDAMRGYSIPGPPPTLLAWGLFDVQRAMLPQVLRETPGGQNVINAKLEEDIDYAARLDLHDVVGVASEGDPIRITLLPSPRWR
jgi:2-phosphosulfolactate phosphatase